MSEAIQESPPRQRLIDTAGRLFHHQGYHETGINQIIEEAQVAKATFYKHFPSKGDLAVDWLKQAQAEMAARLEILKEDESQPPRQRILVIFDIHEEIFLRHHFRGCPSQNMVSEITDPDHPIRREIRAYKETERETFVELAMQALDPSEARQAEKLGDLLYFLMEGCIAEAQSHARMEPIRRARYLASVLIDKAFQALPAPNPGNS